MLCKIVLGPQSKNPAVFLSGAIMLWRYHLILRVEELMTSPKSERGRESGPPRKSYCREAGLRERERGGQAWRVRVTYIMTVHMYRPIDQIYDGPLTPKS